MPNHAATSKQNILVIDQGSHASRIGVFSNSGELLHLQSKTIETHSLEALRYEQSPTEILGSINTLLNNLPKSISRSIEFSGLCTQRSSIVAWNTNTGKALSPVISWRDTRNTSLIKRLKSQSEHIRDLSGLPLSAHYCASKIRWLLDNNEQVQLAKANKQLCIAPLASFLLFHLRQEKIPIIDHSNAQRSQLFDIKTLNWSTELLSLFGIDPEILPQCTPTLHNFGRLKFKNIPLNCVCGDQNAALHAFPPLDKHTALINIGTGAFILSPSKETSKKHPLLLYTLAQSHTGLAHFVTEGTVNGAGTALNWAQNHLSKNRQPKHLSSDALFSQLPNWLNEIKHPPIFLNTISGLGSPWWCEAGKAIFIGDNTHQQSAQYVAVIESILFLTFKNLQQLTDMPQTLFLSGGLSKLDQLCQKLADLSQTSVIRFNETETTARGCAWLAQKQNPSQHSNWSALLIDKTFTPAANLPIIQRYEQFVGELSKQCISN